MGKVTVNKKTIYSDKKPTKDEATAEIVYRKPETAVSQKHHVLPKPNMVDLQIEDREERIRIPDGEGNIAISIQHGEDLGELYVNIQFEGTYGQYEFCLNGHNDLLLTTSEWLYELLGEFAAEFDAEITSEPCPHPEQRVALVEATQRLNGTHQTEVRGRIPVPVPTENRQNVQNK